MKIDNYEEKFEPQVEYLIDRNMNNIVSLIKGWDIFDDTIPSFGHRARFAGAPYPANLSEIRKIQIPDEEKPWDAIINVGVNIFGIRDGQEQRTGLLILSSHDTNGGQVYDTEWKTTLYQVKGNDISEICSVEDKVFDPVTIKMKLKHKFGTTVYSNNKADFLQQATEQFLIEVIKLNNIYIPAVEEALEKESVFGSRPRLDIRDLPTALFTVGPDMAFVVGNRIEGMPLSPERMTKGAIGSHIDSSCLISEIDIFGFKGPAQSILVPQITGTVEIFAQYTYNLTEAFRVISIRGNDPAKEPIAQIFVKPNEPSKEIVKKLRNEFKKQPNP